MKKEQKFNIILPAENDINRRHIKGEPYRKILEKVRRIVLHQKINHSKKGIKGFLFYGDVGIGKTITAKAIAYELGVPLIFIDGSDIARKFYGESESQIGQIFSEANRQRYTVILIDDAESVFPTRDWAKSEAWHFAQNNTFFHKLDNIDSSKTVVILTTNRYDLIDDAIKDRLYNIEFPLPTKEVLKEIAEYKCQQLNMKPESVYEEIDNGIRTVRELEKVITERYIEEVLSKSNII